jgi:hypothetical protein
MTNYPTDAEARVALHGVEQARRRVIDQIGMPWWYWWGLAVAWAGLGVASDLANAWVTTAATVAVGAAHATSRNDCWRAGSAGATSGSAPKRRDHTTRRS